MTFQGADQRPLGDIMRRRLKQIYYTFILFPPHVYTSASLAEFYLSVLRRRAIGFMKAAENRIQNPFYISTLRSVRDEFENKEYVGIFFYVI